MDQKRIDAFNALVDDRIMTYGIYNTMIFLADFGFTANEFVDMGFERVEAERVVRMVKEGEV